MLPFWDKKENISAELFKDVMTKYVNLSPEKLSRHARSSFRKIYCLLISESESTDKIVSELKNIILSAVYADENLTMEEKWLAEKLYTRQDRNSEETVIFPFSREYIYFPDTDTRTKTLNFYESVSAEIKVEILRLIICFASIDKKISKEESVLIRDLLQHTRT